MGLGLSVHLKLTQRPLCLFVSLFVGCCVVTQNAGAMLSNLLPQPPGNLSCEIIHLYEVIRYTCVTLRILLLHCVVASLKCRHYTVNGNAGTTPSNLPKPDMSPEVHCNLCNHCYTLRHV
jgi:hypothetical protein